MNWLSIEQLAKVIGGLIEGCSSRATVRLTGIAKKTVSQILVEVGEACAAQHDKLMRNLPCKVLQMDEVWAFCYAKDRNVPERLKGVDGVGSVWTWIAIDADTKLIPSWHVDNRNAEDAYWFMQDLKGRLSNRVQSTSDGHRPYIQAVEDAFGSEIDYAMLVKLYGSESQSAEARYSPPACIGARRRKIIGKPDRSLISTSFIERQNLTPRMNNRRLTRLTNAFSKKLDNHKHSLALHFFHYNFCRIHQLLRMTPAMEAGITNRVWNLEEIASLCEKPVNSFSN